MEQSETFKAARAFCESYGNAMAYGSDPAATKEQCAARLGAHFGASMVVFAFGRVVTVPAAVDGTNPWLASIKAELDQFDNTGLGMQIRLVKYRVEVYSEGSAQCWITWAIEPRKGGPFENKGWEWDNIYAWRRAPGDTGKDYWEYVVTDNQIASFEQRVPGIYSGAKVMT